MEGLKTKLSRLDQAVMALQPGYSFFAEGAKIGDKEYQKVMASARKLGVRLVAESVQRDVVYMTAGVRFHREWDE